MMGKEKEVAVKEVRAAHADLKQAQEKKHKQITAIEKERLKIYELREVTTKLQFLLVEASKARELQREETQLSQKVKGQLKEKL